MISFRTQTGGFELLSIESSEPLHIRFRGNFWAARAAPRSRVGECVGGRCRAEEVIDGVQADLKEYYVEPAVAQQMAYALKAHEPRVTMLRSQMAMHLRSG
jgi:hypothetical protein